MMRLTTVAWLTSVLMVGTLVACGGEEEETVETSGEDESADEASEESESDEEASDDDELTDDEFGDDELGELGDDELDDEAPTELQVDADELVLDDSTRDRVAPERRSLAHILIRYQGADRASGVTRSKADAEALAREVLGRAQSEDFAVVAAEVSEDQASKDHGGDMGTLEQGLLPEPLDDALFSMEIGEIRGPIERPLGFHILRRAE